MHEPDGVRGVNALRREEPSLREQILEHESIGLLRDATACYDRAIQLESDQVRANMHTYVRLSIRHDLFCVLLYALTALCFTPVLLVPFILQFPSKCL